MHKHLPGHFLYKFESLRGPDLEHGLDYTERPTTRRKARDFLDGLLLSRFGQTREGEPGARGGPSLSDELHDLGGECVKREVHINEGWRGVQQACSQ